MLKRIVLYDLRLLFMIHKKIVFLWKLHTLHKLLKSMRYK